MEINTTKLFFKQNEFLETNFMKSFIKDIDRDITIIHHNDLDGICSAVLMNLYLTYGLSMDPNKIHFISYCYDKDFDFNKYLEEYNSDFVFILDLSLKLNQYLTIKSVTHNRQILLIDHHITTISDLNKHKDQYLAMNCLETYVDTNGCGTMNVYRLIKNEYIYKDRVMLQEVINPTSIKLVDTYDRWIENENKFKADCINQYFYSSNQLFVESEEIEKFLLIYDYNELNKIYNIGKSFIEKNRELNELRYKYFHKDIKFKTKDDTEFNICVLWGSGNSQVFGDHIADYDFVVLARKEKVGYSYSLYTIKENINVAVIAQMYGGGGHPKASGFSTLENIFK